MGNARTCLHVDGQPEYSRCQGYALHLVGPARCSVLWAVETEWNHHRGSVSNVIYAFKPSIEGETVTVPKKDTTKLSSSMTMLSHMSQDRSKHTWKVWNGRSYPTRRTLQTLLLPTTICFDRWHTAWVISISTLMKKLKNRSIRGSPQKTHHFFQMVSKIC